MRIGAGRATWLALRPRLQRPASSADRGHTHASATGRAQTQNSLPLHVRTRGSAGRTRVCARDDLAAARSRSSGPSALCPLIEPSMFHVKRQPLSALISVRVRALILPGQEANGPPEARAQPDVAETAKLEQRHGERTLAASSRSNVMVAGRDLGSRCGRGTSASFECRRTLAQPGLSRLRTHCRIT